MTAIMTGVLLTEIDKYSDRYEFNFQIWGQGKYTMYIEKGGIEMTSFGGRDTLDEVLSDTLQWIYRVNRVPNDKRILIINANF